MTVATTDFGYIIDQATPAYIQSLYCAVPHLNAPQKWCSNDQKVRHKLRCRLHIDSAIGADVLNFKGTFDDSEHVFISDNATVDDWTTAYSAGATMDEYPVGDPLPDDMAEGDAQRFYHGWLHFHKGAADVECNGIEIGAVHDSGYGDRDVELTKTQSSHSYLQKDALSSWLMNWVAAQNVNRMIYSGDTDRSAWRFSIPLLGGR